MRSIAIFYGREIEGSIEIFDEFQKEERIFKNIQSLYYKREREIRKEFQEKIGVLDNTDYPFPFRCYINEKEIKNKTNQKLIEEGYLYSDEYGKFHIVETPHYKSIITYGNDCGYDNLGDICVNFAITIEIFKK